MTGSPTRRTPGRPDPASRAEIDRAIADAGRAEFAEHGLQDARMDRIAARANVTKVAVYRRYADKTELLLALVDEAAEELAAEVGSWSHGGDALVALEAIMRALRTRMTRPDQVAALRLIAGAATIVPGLGPRLDRWRPRLVAPIDRLIGTLLEEGRIRAAPVALIRDTLLDLLVNGASSLALNNMQGQADDDEAFRFRWSMLVDSLVVRTG